LNKVYVFWEFPVVMRSKLLTSYLPETMALALYRPKPGMVTVNLTDRCNQRCIYCEIGQDRAPGIFPALTRDDLTWIIDQMAIHKIRKISLCGGEPFLFDGLIDVVAHAGKKHIRTSVTTNGMTVHSLDETSLAVLKQCKTEINLSIDSFKDTVQTFTRGTPWALANALKSLERLKEKGIPVTVLTVISRFNFHDLAEFTCSACERGIAQVLFQPVIYYSNYPDRAPLAGKSNLNVDPGELDLLMDELKKILMFEKDNPIKTNVYRLIPWIRCYLETAAGRNGKWFFKEVLQKFYCRELYAIIDISYSGGIQPCGLKPATVSIMGNRQPGLLELWSQATREIKADLEKGKYYPCCNGCCHHFSRNMLASMMKYPLQNRKALAGMLPLILSRMYSGVSKKLCGNGNNLSSNVIS
jgi:MoaA/NifB/PqqE/SkfB family radical SAM enzyme